MNTSMHPGYTKDTINLILSIVLVTVGTEGPDGVSSVGGESRLS